MFFSTLKKIEQRLNIKVTKDSGSTSDHCYWSNADNSDQWGMILEDYRGADRFFRVTQWSPKLHKHVTLFTW